MATKDSKEKIKLNTEMPDDLDKAQEEIRKLQDKLNNSVELDQIKEMNKEIAALKITLIGEQILKKKVQEIVKKYTGIN